MDDRNLIAAPSSIEPVPQTTTVEETVLKSEGHADFPAGGESVDKREENSNDKGKQSAEIITDDGKCSLEEAEEKMNSDGNIDKNIVEFKSTRNGEEDKNERIDKTYPSKADKDDGEGLATFREANDLMVEKINDKSNTNDGSNETDNQIPTNENLVPDICIASATGSEAKKNEENAPINKCAESQVCEDSKDGSNVVENMSSEVDVKEIGVDVPVVTEKTTQKVSTIEQSTEIIEIVEYTDKTQESVTESFELSVQSSEESNANGIQSVEIESAIKNETIVTAEREESPNEHLISEKSISRNENVEQTLDPREALKNGESPEAEKTSDSSCSRISTPSENPLKQRSVIEDIYDDWQDDNVEDEASQQLSKSHDSVEMELKILLHDEKSTDESCQIKNDDKGSNRMKDGISECTEKSSNSRSSIGSRERTTIGETLKRDSVKPVEGEACEKRNIDSSRVEESTEQMEPRKSEKSSEFPMARERLIKQKPLAPRPGVKVPGILLTSPIVSKSAVSKVLKERIREQQKEFDSPTKPDLFFVKKITQRLSHKLAAASAAQVPGLLPIPQISKSSSTTSEVKKTTSNVDKELLAILEGDVDPDWSNLKVPNSVVEEAKSGAAAERNTSTKLDPVIEREMALKQLLELPSSPSKKVAIKKTPTKAPRTKAPNVTKPKDTPAQISGIIGEGETTTTMTVSNVMNPESTFKEDSMDSNLSSQEYKSDETRSGRKRKPTEKAREHENSTKRMKVSKGKTSLNKRKSQEDEQSPTINDSAIRKNETIDESVSEKFDEVAKKHIDETTLESPLDSHNEESSSEPINKKVVLKPSTKRKMPTGQAKQKITISKKSTVGKITKGIAKKTGTKMATGKGQKQRNGETSQAEGKPKKKVINEIDRLLQDEGVVNLLYDVEQPDKKRLVPITKSQTKVMDLQKIQRELKIRTKLVRNAVLRLRTSNIPTNKVSPRSKRSISHSSDFYAEKKTSDSKIALPTSPTDFIYPAKIRNAADASVIIRRHSSSSFSSASVSPRASIDGPERLSIDDVNSTSHALRSNKRRLSHEDEKKKKKPKQSPEPKKNRRKITERSESETKSNEDEAVPIFNVPLKTNKTAGSTPTNFSTSSDSSPTLTPVKLKKIDLKKNQKSLKHLTVDIIDIDENIAGNSGKVATRSNASLTTSAGKIISKSNPSSVAKSLDFDEKQFNTEPRVQFSNNEITVQRHGKLVQLLLTPSTSTKIRNGITLQVMQEIRENLSILKKDEECRVVLLTSTGTSFCEGLELSTLLHEEKDERRQRAEELANAVKEFIKSLATFNKPIVAGVQGTAIGLGVTMLPWFDLVIASDKATFSTPYGKLGQIAEGAAVFTLSHILGSSVTSELLLGGRTLTANEALRAGLVTRVLWPDRFKDELLPSLRAMSEQSSQSMEATKALLRHNLRKKLDAALESESYLLVQHWCSAECQAAITAYVDEKIQ
ncbi:microtubule-associated protein futsch isoform X2 [Venturia canescens]|uniref:microtubule-associated protein futsch isoform X2 n=1 Tax=Venturia canescens TaxID=32260 RepID=UPI001C9D0533|nr:microtubule-associated protein futsch isoform X2 [Venturia canescens]